MCSPKVQLHRQMKMIFPFKTTETSCQQPGQVKYSASYWHTTAADQVSVYLDMDLSEGDDDCLLLWQRNSVGLNKLFLRALHALVLSFKCPSIQLCSWTCFQPRRPNIILQPQTAWMGDTNKLLSQQIILKCNSNFSK